MVIRKLKQKKTVNARVIFLFILLCVGTYFLIKLFIGIVDKFNQTPQGNMVYTLGATLSFSGKLVSDNNFPIYTHSIITSDGIKVGLKSTTINLNAYVNQKIILVGTVKKYFKITPVVEVTALKFLDQGLILKDNRYFFVNDLLYLDFSTQPQLSAIKSGSDIVVFFGESPIVHIERFVCSKILKTRDCKYLITNYIQTHKDNFESYRSYTFYKHSTGFWTTFDDNLYGYLFKTISDDIVLDISNMFRMVNKEFVIENKIDLIQSNCQDAFSQLYTIDSMEGSFEYKDPYIITVDLRGIDNKKNPATCRIAFDVWNDWEVVDREYNGSVVSLE